MLSKECEWNLKINSIEWKMDLTKVEMRGKKGKGGVVQLYLSEF